MSDPEKFVPVKLIPVKLLANYPRRAGPLPSGYIVGLPEVEVQRLEKLKACVRVDPKTPEHTPRNRAMPAPKTGR
jgi:hypothetical protein